MALFKILKGNKATLPSTINEGWAYVTSDEHKMYIDTDASTRIALNADLADRVSYGTCGVAAGTALKTVALTDESVFNLVSGKLLVVYFSSSNTATSPSLQVSGVSKPIKRLGSEAPGADTYTSWTAGSVVTFVYDGTNEIWRIVAISDRKYAGITFSDAGVITASKFKGAIEGDVTGNLTGNVTGNVSGSSGSCTGNAATATTLETGRTINGTTFNGSKNIITEYWGTARNITIKDSDDTNAGTATSVNGAANAVLHLPSTIKASITGDVSGNAGTATKWQTARTLTIGSTGKSVDGSGNVSWSLAEIGATVSNAWNANKSSGPSLVTTVNGVASAAAVFPTANTTQSGVITADTQTIGGKKTFNSNVVMTQDLQFTGVPTLHWNDGTYHQRIFIVDDSTADTAVFKFQQSADSGSTFTDLFTIKDNGKVVANYFVGSLTGNADTATKFNSNRLIKLTGNVTGQANADGSSGWEISTSIGTGVVTNTMLAGSIANAKLANSSITLASRTISLGSTVSKADILADLGLSYAMHYLGITSTAMSDGLETAAVTIGGNSVTPFNGDVVIDDDTHREFVWDGDSWELLGGDDSYKVKQDAVDSGAAATNKWVSRIQQDINGKLTISLSSLDTSGTWSGNAGSASKWATARTLSISATAGTTGTSVDGSGNATLIVPSTMSGFAKISSTNFTGALTGNADTASKWANKRTISISSTAGTTGTSVDGSANATLIVPATMTGFTSITSTAFSGALSGNASTATTLQTARTINGTSFDGSSNITTENWGTSRTISISSAAGTTGTSVNGSKNVSLVVPSTMTGFSSITSTSFVGALTGNASSASKVNNSLTIEGKTFNGSADIAVGNTIHYIVGPSTDTTAGTWTGTDSTISAYFDGLTIMYVPAVAGAGTTTLNINGLGAKTCYYTNTSKLTTHFSVGTPILLTYYNGTWKRADYDSNTNTAIRLYKDESGTYPIIGSRTAAASVSSGSTTVYGEIDTDTITMTPSTGTITATTFSGALSGNATSATALTSSAGSATLPIYFSDGKPVACTASSVFSALSWTAGTTAGPTLSVTVAGQNRTSTIPSASASASGIITTNPQTFAGNKTFNNTVTVNGDLKLNNTPIYWDNGGTVTQRLLNTDDSDSDTAVFTFQQSTDYGSTWTNLMTIRDNSKVIATTFVGALSGNASTASKWATARTFSISNTAGTTGTSVDGSENETLIIPATISGFTKITATTFSGALSGNATSATKATNDSDGNAINTTYLKKRSMIETSTSSVTSGTSSGTASVLRIYGTTYGNDSAYLTTSGKLSYGDPGPQIQFSSSATAAQDGALIFTDHDTIGSGVSLSFVTNQSDAYFIAPHIKALSGFIGNLSGNASTATAFSSNRTIALTGNVTGSVASNGASGWSIATTIADSAVTNAMLAGSIANGKLANSSIVLAGRTINLGDTVTKANMLSDLGLSTAMHYIGKATVDITDGSTTDPTISGYSTKTAGDVIIDKNSNFEFVWNGSTWEALGPESSYKVVQSTVDSGAATTNKWVSRVQQDANGKVTITMGTLDTSGTWSGNAATSTRANTLLGSYTGSGGQQGPGYFGTNKVGALMMNTTVNSNSQYKDWLIMDCYSGSDVGGAVAIGVNRQSLGAYIMRSAAARSTWAESAELIGTHNYTTYCAKASHSHTASYTPAGSVAAHSYTPAGTIADISYTPAGSVASHVYTPAGTVASHVYTPAGTVSNHVYTPAGDISKPDITITPSETTVTSGFSAGSLPTLTYTYDSTNERMTVSWNAGTLPSASTSSVLNASTTAALDDAPTFVGTEATLKHTFTGTQATLAHTFTGTQATLAHTFTGTKATLSTTFTGTKATLEHTFTGTTATITST